MLAKIPRVYWAAAIIIIVVTFYVFSTLKENRLRNPSRFSINVFSGHDFDVPFARFAGAETLRGARSEELIAEIEKVIEQNGLPADVFFGLSSSLSKEEREKLQELHDHNIAVTLHELFGAYYEHVPNDPDKLLNDNLEQLWNASPVGEWDVDKEALDRVQVMLALFEKKRQDVRKALENASNTVFYYIFNRPESLKTFSYREMMVNTGASKYLADYALLEEYVIAQALLDGNIKEAVDALAYIFRITDLASQLQDVGVRADVAHVRLRTFDVMQRVVLDPKFERQHMIRLRNMLQEQHQNWIPEHLAWFGDRADGIKFYHHVTLHGVDALEDAEFEELERRRMVEAFQQSFRAHHELDKIFYLQSMQRIIDVSRQPFIQRRDVLHQINRERLARANTYHPETGTAMEPFVANFRLKDVDNFMQLFAQDQSALRRALVATYRSLGHSNTDIYRDPYTDQPYTVRRVDGLLHVSAPPLPRPFRVPVFTAE